MTHSGLRPLLPALLRASVPNGATAAPPDTLSTPERTIVRAVDPGAAGAADVSFTAGLVSRALDGVGLAGRDDHTVRETADLAILPMLTQRAAVLLHRLGRPAPP